MSPSRDPFTEQCDDRLRKNLACLARHRPEVHATLDSLRGPSQFFIAGTASGLPTVAFAAPGQPRVVLSHEGDPRKTVEKLSSDCREELLRCRPLALACVGDGYFLSALSQAKWSGTLGEEQFVLIIAPDPTAVPPCLMLHDYTGPMGPIEQERFQWLVGPDWAERLESRLRADPFLPLPDRTVDLGPGAQNVASGIRAVYAKLGTELFETIDSLGELKSEWTPERLVERFGPEPDRPPRVLIVTSRFTTVLQYVARDTARAFRRAGWTVNLVKEPSNYHRFTNPARIRSVAEFRPDIVFMVSRLRHDCDRSYPAEMPFVAWAQDTLPNLMCRAAGESIGDRDFVLTYSPGLLDQHGYPESQMIPVPIMVTSSKTRPATWATDGADLVYVSHVSETVEQRIEIRLQMVDEHLRSVAREASCMIQRAYEHGGSIDSVAAIRATAAELLESLSDRDANAITDTVLGPVNTVLYRHQALEWIADIADREGYSLALHGTGWEKHARFGRYAAGPVANGHALDDLTRRSRINLNLEPYPCHTHQRLLDGLSAGGFFLIRNHPVHRVWNTLAKEYRDDIESLEGWLESAEDRDALQQCLANAEAQCYETHPDALRQLRAYLECGVIVPGEDEPIPDLGRVTFSTPMEAQERIATFLNDAPERRAISQRQWDSIRGRLTFDVVVERLQQRLWTHFSNKIRTGETA